MNPTETEVCLEEMDDAKLTVMCLEEKKYTQNVMTLKDERLID